MNTTDQGSVSKFFVDFFLLRIRVYRRHLWQTSPSVSHTSKRKKKNKNDGAALSGNNNRGFQFVCSPSLRYSTFRDNFPFHAYFALFMTRLTLFCRLRNFYFRQTTGVGARVSLSLSLSRVLLLYFSTAENKSATLHK